MFSCLRMNTKRLGYSLDKNSIFNVFESMLSSFLLTVLMSINWYFLAFSNRPASFASFKNLKISKGLTKPGNPFALIAYARVVWDRPYIRGITWWRWPENPRIIAIGSLASRPNNKSFLSSSLIVTKMSKLSLMLYRSNFKITYKNCLRGLVGNFSCLSRQNFKLELHMSRQ